MSEEEVEHVPAEEVEVLPTASTKAVDYRTKVIENARASLSRFVPRAIELLTELAETSENDRVRLAAVDSILDRAGVGKSSTQEVKVSQAEHDAARNEADDLLKKLGRNKGVLDTPTVKPSLEALVVLEGEPSPAS